MLFAAGRPRLEELEDGADIARRHELVDGPLHGRPVAADLECDLDDAERVRGVVSERVANDRAVGVGGLRREVLQDARVVLGVGILELPTGQQLRDLIAKGGVGNRPGRLGSGARLRREFRHQPDHAVRDHLTVGVGRRLHDLQHRSDIHSVGGIEDERAALRRVPAHVNQTAQRFRTQAGDEDRGSLAERLDLGGRRGPELAGNLQEVADDDLVVGGGPVLLFDGARDVGRVGRHRGAFGLARGNRGAGQADPQLGGAGAPGAAPGAGSLAAIADQ